MFFRGELDVTILTHFVFTGCIHLCTSVRFNFLHTFSHCVSVNVEVCWASCGEFFSDQRTALKHRALITAIETAKRRKTSWLWRIVHSSTGNSLCAGTAYAQYLYTFGSFEQIDVSKWLRISVLLQKKIEDNALNRGERFFLSDSFHVHSDPFLNILPRYLVAGLLRASSAMVTASQLRPDGGQTRRKMNRNASCVTRWSTNDTPSFTALVGLIIGRNYCQPSLWNPLIFYPLLKTLFVALSSRKQWRMTKRELFCRLFVNFLDPYWLWLWKCTTTRNSIPLI